MAAHIRLVTNTEDGGAEALSVARKYSKKARTSAPVWLARLEAEERFGDTVDIVWREAKKFVKGTVDEVESVWKWGMKGQESQKP